MAATKVPVAIVSSEVKLKDKHQRFMVSEDFTIGRFQLVVRRRCLEEPLQATDALWLFIHNRAENKRVLCKPQDSIGLLHAEYKTKKGVLEIDLRKENTFG